MMFRYLRDADKSVETMKIMLIDKFIKSIFFHMNDIMS